MDFNKKINAGLNIRLFTNIILFILFIGLFAGVQNNKQVLSADSRKVVFTDTVKMLYTWDSYQFKAEIKYKGKRNTTDTSISEKSKLRYTASDSSVAFISSKKGVLKAKKPGKVIVTVTDKISGLTDTCEVIIKKGPPKPLSDITKNRYTKVKGMYYKSEKIQTADSEKASTADSEKTQKVLTEDIAKISLTGDIMCLRAQQNAVNRNGIYNFNNSFKHVKKLFERTDYAIGNLETLISYSNPITSVMNLINNAPNCNAPGTFLDALRYAGYCSVATANNHCCDGDVTGILETIEVLDCYDIAHVGTYNSSKTKRYILADINGIKVAFLSYTELINQRSSLTEAEHKKHVGRFIVQDIENDIAVAREAGAEFIIAYNHWGTENTHSVMARQKSDAKALADAGVDLIVGSHPHCLQKAEYIKAEDGRKVLCVYSMGNFVSSMASTINNDTIILEVILKRNKKTGAVKLKEAGYIPCRVYHSYGSDRHVIIPTNAKFNGGIENNTLKEAAKRIRSVMGNDISEIIK